MQLKKFLSANECIGIEVAAINIATISIRPNVALVMVMVSLLVMVK